MTSYDDVLGGLNEHQQPDQIDFTDLDSEHTPARSILVAGTDPLHDINNASFNRANYYRPASFNNGSTPPPSSFMQLGTNANAHQAEFSFEDFMNGQLNLGGLPPPNQYYLTPHNAFAYEVEYTASLPPTMPPGHPFMPQPHDEAINSPELQRSNTSADLNAGHAFSGSDVHGSGQLLSPTAPAQPYHHTQRAVQYMFGEPMDQPGAQFEIRPHRSSSGIMQPSTSSHEQTPPSQGQQQPPYYTSAAPTQGSGTMSGLQEQEQEQGFKSSKVSSVLEPAVAQDITDRSKSTALFRQDETRSLRQRAHVRGRVDRSIRRPALQSTQVTDSTTVGEHTGSDVTGVAKDFMLAAALSHGMKRRALDGPAIEHDSKRPKLDEAMPSEDSNSDGTDARDGRLRAALEEELNALESNTTEQLVVEASHHQAVSGSPQHAAESLVSTPADAASHENSGQSVDPVKKTRVPRGKPFRVNPEDVDSLLNEPAAPGDIAADQITTLNGALAHLGSDPWSTRRHRLDIENDDHAMLEDDEIYGKLRTKLVNALSHDFDAVPREPEELKHYIKSAHTKRHINVKRQINKNGGRQNACSKVLLLIEAAKELHTVGMPCSRIDLNNFDPNTSTEEDLKKAKLSTKTGYAIEGDVSCISRLLTVLKIVRANKYVAFDVLHANSVGDLYDLVSGPHAYIERKYENAIRNAKTTAQRETRDRAAGKVPVKKDTQNGGKKNVEAAGEDAIDVLASRGETGGVADVKFDEHETVNAGAQSNGKRKRAEKGKASKKSTRKGGQKGKGKQEQMEEQLSDEDV